MPRSNDKPHLPCLTALRGIAALCVLLHHLTGHLLPRSGAWLGGHTGFFARGYLWVDFFFVLSGFLLAYLYMDEVTAPDRSYLRFLRARLARIYPLHLVTLLAVLALNLAMVGAEIRSTGLDAWLDSANFRELRFYGHDSLATFVQHLLLLNSLHPETWSSWNSPSWSIGAEWIAYLLFPALVWPARRLPRLTVIASLPVALLGTWCLTRLMRGNLDLAGISGVARCLLEFALGVAVFRLRQRAPLARGAGPVLVLGILGAAFVLHADVPDPVVIIPFTAMVWAGSQPAGAVGRILAARPLVYLGEISYSVYMTHWVMLLAARWLWRGLAHEELGASFGASTHAFALASATAVTIAVSAVSYRYLERPARRRIRGDKLDFFGTEHADRAESQ